MSEPMLPTRAGTEFKCDSIFLLFISASENPSNLRMYHLDNTTVSCNCRQVLLAECYPTVYRNSERRNYLLELHDSNGQCHLVRGSQG